MKKGSTLILKTVVLFLGLIVLAICAFALPAGIKSEITGDFDYGWIFVGMYFTALPFFYALYQAIKLLTYIENDKVFTKPAVKTLNMIKYCAYIISAMFILGMPYIFYLGDKDDAPGVVAIGLVIIFASFVIGTCAAVFKRLLQRAVVIKKENDLTV